MKALTIYQPYADMIVAGVKDIENRTWSTNVRGRVAIHASKRWDASARQTLEVAIKCGWLEPDHVCELGAVVGTVVLSDCVRDHPSNFFHGPFGFVFRQAIRLDEPVSVRGRQGWFEVEL